VSHTLLAASWQLAHASTPDVAGLTGWNVRGFAARTNAARLWSLTRRSTPSSVPRLRVIAEASATRPASSERSCRSWERRGWASRSLLVSKLREVAPPGGNVFTRIEGFPSHEASRLSSSWILLLIARATRRSPRPSVLELESRFHDEEVDDADGLQVIPTCRSRAIADQTGGGVVYHNRGGGERIQGSASRFGRRCAVNRTSNHRCRPSASRTSCACHGSEFKFQERGRRGERRVAP